MNDIRRTILWVIFGFSVLMLWDQWQVANGRPGLFTPPKPQAAATAHAPAPAASSVPQASTSAPATTAAVPATATPPASAAAAPHERFTVASDIMKITFDTEGGSIVRTEFLEHPAETGTRENTETFVLLDESAGREYVAQSGLIGGDFPNHKTVMTASGDRTLKEGANEMQVRFESPVVGGVKLVKTYTIKRGSYEIGVKHEVVNAGTAPVQPQLYLQIVRDGKELPGASSFYSTFTGPAVYTEEQKFQKVKFEDIEKNKADIQKESDRGYVAMVQHYFASAWILPEGIKRELFVRAIPSSNAPQLGPLFAVGMIDKMAAVPPGQQQTVNARFFAGPENEKMLEKIEPGLELVKDYGHLTILAKPLYWLLDKIHSILGNWGWSIMALVLLIKIAFYWLQAKGYESMAKMKAINPKVMAMRERYKDKPQEMQQEMMRIYREER
jgi:YidC/Oxa1 family membrane protein insertase